MKRKKAISTAPLKKDVNGDNLNPPSNPLYPASDDIYNKSIQEAEIDPENITLLKVPDVPEQNESENEIGVENFDSISELDIPGSELDDQLELIGSEDEENNYYSLGGDNHDDPEESKED